MSTYAKITDFAAKDSLLTGNPSKIVKGTEIGAEFDSIATADASNVKGPTSAVTNNALVRWDTTTGRLSKNSTVTADDTGNITGTSFTGAHNGTVGATTPNTGAFTTLSTTDNVTLQKTGGLIQFKNTAGTVRTGYIQETTGNLAIVGEVAGSVVDTYANNTKITTVSSTGLAVTGAVSASGTATFGTSTAPTVGSQQVASIGNSSGGTVALMHGASLAARISASTAGVDIYNPNPSPVQIYSNGSAVGSFSSTGLAVTGALSATGVSFSGSAPANSLTLDASGNLLVGTTQRGHNGGVNSVDLDKTDGAAYVTHVTGTASGNYYMSFGYNTTSIGSITQNGTTAVAFNTTSDHRLKLNVRDANAARFMDIQFRDFEWVDGRHDCGVIAHELQAVYPDLVMGEKDAVETRTVEITPAVLDDEGNVVTPAVTEEQTFPVYQQVNYIGLIGRMGTVIQKQQRAIDTLVARLAAAGIA